MSINNKLLHWFNTLYVYIKNKDCRYRLQKNVKIIIIKN